MSGNGELSTETFHWVVQRPDGVGFALTSHNQSYEVDGVVFDAAPSLDASTLTLSETLWDSELKLGGALTTDGISERDLRAGRWDRAGLALYWGDWDRREHVGLLVRGRFGATRLQGGRFESDLSLVPDQLAEEACPQTSPECRAQLGDSSCRVSMRGRRRRVSVIDLDGPSLRVDLVDTEPFSFGQLRWLTGRNAGLTQTIITSSPSTLLLGDEPPYPVAEGARVLLFEGCDGRLQTCSERFENALNFRGEPFVPGTDLMLRYPGD